MDGGPGPADALGCGPGLPLTTPPREPVPLLRDLVEIDDDAVVGSVVGEHGLGEVPLADLHPSVQLGGDRRHRLGRDPRRAQDLVPRLGHLVHRDVLACDAEPDDAMT
ncbi:hypothetical protein [Actinomycetospora soli]|uniref:hypothetical protein n=1 Tax=Actinomycetospora soli TaxID=2893887 RepID=UPI001E4C66CD|nr:hypothetical protein [Actinomycetospora soli]MCD2186610.1 hypothetical protein [Actinomycetospora soli]